MKIGRRARAMAMAALLSATMLAAPARAQVPLPPEILIAGYGVKQLATILDAANSAKELFSGNRDQRETRKRLKEIREQNIVTHQMLGEVLTILRQLDVTIRQEIAVAKQNEVLANIKVADSNLDTGTETGRYGRRTADDLADIRLRLQVLAGELANSVVYGFAHYDYVGKAMIAEFDIAQAIKADRRVSANQAIQYQAFFEDVLNADKPGSIAEAIKRNEAIKSDYESWLAKASVQLQGRIWQDRNVVVGRTSCGEDIVEDQYWQIALNDQGRYEQRLLRSGPRRQGPCSPGGAAGGGNHFMSPDPVVKPNWTAKERQGFIGQLNAALAAVAEQDKKLKSLRLARATAETYRDIAVERARI